MVSVNIRELTHNFSKYLKAVKDGERIVIMERTVAVADIIPHNENVSLPGWSRNINKISIKGESLSETIIRNRRKEKR